MKRPWILGGTLVLIGVMFSAGFWLNRVRLAGPSPALKQMAPAAPILREEVGRVSGLPGQIRVCQHPEEAPAWAIGYGQEFWQRTASSNRPGARPAVPGDPPGFNLGGVIERVSHAFVANGTGDSPQVHARTYLARLQANQLIFAWARPPAGGATVTAEAGAAANPAPVAGERSLAALAPRTPETPEEEDQLMARLTELAAQDSVSRPSSPALGSSRSIAAGSAAAVDASAPDRSAAATFQTTAVRQGSRAVYEASMPALSWVVLGNTAQALLDAQCGLVEHLEAGRAGVTVTWILPRASSVAQPLRIEAQLTGLQYAGETPNGHHFADASGVARLRIGKVTIADTAGARWQVPIQVQDQILSIDVPADVLAEAAYPVAVDPLISPEFGMDTPILDAAPAAQQNPAVAANGAGFFVAWEDQRSVGGASIYGTRVTGAGLIGDPNGIVLSPPGAAGPAVAPNGSGYLVVWADGRNAATTGLDIYGTRVDSAGKVLEAGGIPISQAAGDQYAPAVAANGTGSLVVWQDGRSVDTGPDIYGARVTSAGIVTDAGGIPISTAPGAQASPAIGFNGADFLVVWTDQRGGGDFQIYGARVTSAGAVLDNAGISISSFGGGEYFPKVAGSGTNFLVVWEDDRNAGSGFIDVYGARVTDAGALLERDGFPIGTGLGDRHAPAVASSGSDCLVVWQDARDLGTTGQDIYGARVTAAGKVSDPSGFGISTAPEDQSAPALAFNGSQYLVAWTDARNLATSDLDIYGTLVSTGTVVAPAAGFLITSGPAGELRPATASNGTNYLVVWQDLRNSAASGADIYGVRVSTSGAVLDLSALPISTATADQLAPAVATDGQNYLVVWEDYRNAANAGVDIYGTRVTSAGSVQDPNGIAISVATADQRAPAVAGSTGPYLVVWQDGRNLANSGADIYGARVSRAGVLLETNGVAIATAAGDQYSAAVAFNGTNHLVVWSDERNLGSSGADIYGTRVSPAGAVLDNPNLVISQSPGDAVFPSVAAAGGDFLVAWEDSRNSVSSGEDIYGARVTGGGVVLDPAGLAVSTAPDFQAVPAVAGSGTNYLVVWQDGRNSLVGGTDLYGARVRLDGTVLDAGGFSLNTGSADQQYPKLASGSLDGFLVVSQSLESGAPRAVGNFVYLDDYPIITRIDAAGGSTTLTWLSIPNRTYRVQFKASLSSLTWSNLVPDVVASSSSSTQVDNTIGASPTRFYRVALLP